MKQKFLFLGCFLVVFLLFELILSHPRFIYIFIVLLGAFSVLCFFKIKKRFGFNERVFLWLAAGFFYLLTVAFFIMFVGQAFLRHALVFLTAFLTAFWLGRFGLFLRSGEINKETDVFLFRVLSLSSFYFGVTGLFGGSIFLNIQPLLLFGVFVVITLLCAVLFWEGNANAGLKPEDTTNTKYFLWALITILSAELALAVYFLPLPIFSLGALVFLFWILLMRILYDYSLGIFEFKKYKTKLILFLMFIAVILFTIEW